MLTVRPMPTVGRVSRTGGAMILAVGFIVLLASSVWLYWTVEGAVNYQREVRFAQRARDAVFRAQLDAETGMRGFTSTRDIRFLAPYGRAQENMDPAFAELRLNLQQLGKPQLVRLVDDQSAVHERWHNAVAAPLLAAPRRPDATRLQNRGKALMNRFRQDDELLDDGINGAASEADSAVNVAVLRIGVVTGLFGLTFIALYAYFSQQRNRMSAETTRQRLLYENEKRIADALQSAFVQKALPVIPNLGFHASYIPAGAEAQVGGDWYDAFELPDGRVLFSIGDVAGHGIEAAVIMSRARQAIISNALHELDPALVLSRANETLMLQEPKMVTAVCGYIDPKTLHIAYATAGHPPPLLALPNAEPYFLDHDGMPLGIMANVTYGSFTATAQEGALFVLYTDGVIEHKRDLIDGQRRLLAAAKLAVTGGASDPAASLRQAIFADKPPEDDVAIMTVSFAVHDERSTATIHAFSPNLLTIAAARDAGPAQAPNGLT